MFGVWSRQARQSRRVETKNNMNAESSIVLNITPETNLLFQRALATHKHKMIELAKSDIMEKKDQDELKKEANDCSFFLSILRREDF